MYSRAKMIAGWVMTGLVGVFMLFDATIHFLKPKMVVDSFIMLGYSPDVSVTIAMLGLLCALLYLIPRTSVLGAVLLTGYLGGAVATNLRVGAPLFANILFPVYVGIVAWGGLYLRDASVRAMMPVRRG